MSKAEYILRGQYALGTRHLRLGMTPRTGSSCAGRIDQIFRTPVVGLAAPAQMPFRIGFECMRPEDIPVLRGVENITPSENRMHDEFSAVRQSIDPALS
jgi:hypothetical protein